MYLVIGGQAQGKLAWVKQHFNITDEQVIDGAVLGFAEKGIQLNNCRVLYNLQELLKHYMQQNYPGDIIDQLVKLSSQTIFICNEVGAGLVPLEQEDRQWRELVGRTCCLLAAEADEVWRVFCGLPQRIK